MTASTFRLALVERPHTRALGSARDGALDVAFDTFENVRRGFLGDGRWDAAEFPLGRYIALKAAGDTSLVAIPVFPWRSFRHGAIHIRNDGSIRTPADLEGHRVGVTDWHQTAGIVARGLLAKEYGVRLERIDWIAAGLNGAPRPEVAPFPAPRGFAVKSSEIPLGALLRNGTIDAVISADPPAGGGTMELVPNHSEVEEAWFARTGIFPLMHVIAVRRSALGALSSLDALIAAFERAKAESVSAQDPKWRYGLIDNKAAIDRLLDDAFTQGIGEKRLQESDLFDEAA